MVRALAGSGLSLCWASRGDVSWLKGLSDNPQQLPSRASSPDFPHGQEELRVALVFDADAFIVYAVSQQDQSVRILYLSNIAPEGFTFRPALRVGLRSLSRLLTSQSVAKGECAMDAPWWWAGSQGEPPEPGRSGAGDGNRTRVLSLGSPPARSGKPRRTGAAGQFSEPADHGERQQPSPGAP